jgi:hypothetical protein
MVIYTLKTKGHDRNSNFLFLSSQEFTNKTLKHLPCIEAKLCNHLMKWLAGSVDRDKTIFSVAYDSPSLFPSPVAFESSLPVIKSVKCLICGKRLGKYEYFPAGSSDNITLAMKNFSFTLPGRSPAVQQSLNLSSPIFSLTQFGPSSAVGMVLSRC